MIGDSPSKLALSVVLVAWRQKVKLQTAVSGLPLGHFFCSWRRVERARGHVVAGGIAEAPGIQGQARAGIECKRSVVILYDQVRDDDEHHRSVACCVEGLPTTCCCTIPLLLQYPCCCCCCNPCVLFQRGAPCSVRLLCLTEACTEHCNRTTLSSHRCFGRCVCGLATPVYSARKMH